jgi:GTP-binding protein
MESSCSAKIIKIKSVNCHSYQGSALKLITVLIKSAKYLVSSPDLSLCPAGDRPEYAFIGRSNVGKSSLINLLCNNQKLAKTSSAPGKTQLINHFDINNGEWYLVDLPGYGFAKVSQAQRRKWEKMIEDYLRKRENLAHVFVLIDSRHSPQKLDLEFVNRLGEWGLSFTLVFTKADKETQAVVSSNIKDFLNKMRASWQFLPAHVVTSVPKQLGRDKLLALIDAMNSEYYSQK